MQPVIVPGRYYFLKWWKLALLVGAVWVVAAPIGLGLFYWWYHSINKTPRYSRSWSTSSSAPSQG
ncbi:hypothetical protein I552_7228 [Mycobacterium xenopi 3993]|nr:hypothetical protein I552_7228 [Mycobacterium xenopi 3993]